MPFNMGIGADPARLIFCGMPGFPPCRPIPIDISGDICPDDTDRIGGPGIVWGGGWRIWPGILGCICIGGPRWGAP